MTTTKFTVKYNCAQFKRIPLSCVYTADRSPINNNSALAILEMRRHYTNYFRALRGIKVYRSRLVTTPKPADVFEILDEIEERYSVENLVAI